VAPVESTPPITDLLSLSADLELVSVDAGEPLISQGMSAPPIYVLVEGSVVVERDGTAFATVDHPGVGRYRMPSSPLRILGSRRAVRRAPLLGEHTDEVLGDVLGMSTGEIGRLHDAGTVG